MIALSILAVIQNGYWLHISNSRKRGKNCLLRQLEPNENHQPYGLNYLFIRADFDPQFSDDIWFSLYKQNKEAKTPIMR